MAIDIRRREFLFTLGGAGVAWPLAARAQQPSLPLIAFANGGTPEASAPYVAAFRKGLGEADAVEGRNVGVEYTWFRGDYRHVPDVMAEFVRRGVAAIVTPGFPTGALA